MIPPAAAASVARLLRTCSKNVGLQRSAGERDGHAGHDQITHLGAAGSGKVCGGCRGHCRGSTTDGPHQIARDGWLADFRGYFGPHVLGFFGEFRPIADFFGELGKLLLMFSAGLEIDIALFRSAQTRSIIFGLFTTIVPLLFGTLLGLGFGDALIPAIVVGSLLAS